MGEAKTLPNLSKARLIQIKDFLQKYERFLFDKYNLRRDEDFNPYYHDDFIDKTIYSDDLVQEVVDLDELLSILDSVKTE